MTGTDRIAGTAKNLGGKAEEFLGGATGQCLDASKGQAEQAEGAAQDLYGQAKETMTHAALHGAEYSRGGGRRGS